MTQTPPHGGYGGQAGPSGADNFFAGLRRIDVRRSEDHWIGGVCSGLAERLGIDALVVRALFGLLSLGMGLGVVLYLIAWLLVPDRHEQTHVEQALRDGRAESVVLLVFTVLAVFGSFGWFGGGWWDGGLIGWSIVSLVALGLGGWWLWSEWTKREQPGYYSQQAASFSSPTASGQPAGPHTPPPYAGSSSWQPSETTDPPRTGATVTEETSGPGSWGRSARAPRPAAPTPPPAPPRPSRRSAGAAGTLLGTGLALLAGGGLAWAASEYDWAVEPWVVGLAGALGALGLVILLLGLLGRTSGFPGFLAVCALVLTVAAVPAGNYFVPSGRVGDVTWTPDASTGDAGPFRLGAGTGVLDLRGVDPGELPDPVEASVSFGTLRIVVPDDLTVRIDAGSGMGSVDGDGRRSVGGVGVDEVIVLGDGPIDLEVEARVGFGQVLVEGRGQ